jgi:hypothetical protein
MKPEIARLQKQLSTATELLERIANNSLEYVHSTARNLVDSINIATEFYNDYAYIINVSYEMVNEYNT